MANDQHDDDLPDDKPPAPTPEDVAISLLPPPSEVLRTTHMHSDQHMLRAFDRAFRVLQAARRLDLPLPMVTLYADGSARFFVPSELADMLDREGASADLLRLIGSDDMRAMKKGVVVLVCCSLGREID